MGGPLTQKKKKRGKKGKRKKGKIGHTWRVR